MSRRTRFKKNVSLISDSGVINVTIPTDFVGMHMHRWPSGVPLSPNPTWLDYGLFRTHDYGGGVHWAAVHTAQGVFNWTGLDACIAYHESRGASILYTVYGCPTWAATTNGKLHSDAYGNVGGADRPANMSDLFDFITALMTRYGTRIKYIEIWNEPHFVQNWTGFFWGSAADLVQMGNTIYTAAKAVNPQITILSPGFSGNGAVSAFLNAVDPVSGKYGYQVFDGFALHPYGETYLGQIYGSDIVNGGSQSYSVTRQLIDANGCSGKNMYITEWGLSGANVPIAFTNNGSPLARRQMLRRTLAATAIAGVKCMNIYSYDHGNLISGDFINDTNGVIAALTDFKTLLAGKTVTRCRSYYDGSMDITTTNGSVAF